MREWLNKKEYEEFGGDRDCHQSISLNKSLREAANNLSAKNSLILSTTDWKSYFAFIINHNMSDEIAESH